MKRNAFGQLGPGFAPTHHRPFLRYFAPVEGEGGGNDGGDGDGGSGSGGSEFKPIESQEEFEKRLATRIARADRAAREDERKKIAAASDKPEPKPKPKEKADDDKPAAVTEDDVDKRIKDALAAKDLELAVERVSDQLDKALEGRKYPASILLNLDRSQFVKDGKSVDAAALKKWVDENTTEADTTDTKRRRLPGQGERDGDSTGLEAGKSAYQRRHPQKKDK